MIIKNYALDKFFNKIGKDFVYECKQYMNFEFNIEFDDFEWCIFLSDGLDSFTQKIQTQTSVINMPIDKFKILKKLLPFKNFKGQFVQRRLNAFKKECVQLGWDHYDDLSIAVMANK